MNEYISRELLFERLNEKASEHYNVVINDVIRAIPAADVVPVKRGRWENPPSYVYRRCSLCKADFDKPKFNVRANFCPNCGARMEG